MIEKSDYNQKDKNMIRQFNKHQIIEKKIKDHTTITHYRGKESWNDFKLLENLVFNAKCKIIDFGLGKDLKESEGITTSICGSPVTMAPEIWKNKLQGKFKEGYNYKVDIWSTGCIIFSIITNSPPFPGDEIEKICNKVMNFGQYYVPLIHENGEKSDVTVELLDLLTGLLRFNPETRLDWKDVINHPFLNTPSTKQLKMNDFLIALDSKNVEEQRILGKLNIKNGKTLGIVFNINEEPYLIELAKHKGLLEKEIEINKNLQMKFVMQNNIENYFDLKDDKARKEIDNLIENYDITEEFQFIFEEDEDGYIIVNKMCSSRKKSD